ncbi:MAG TPA: helix-turn-helix domain-containing protein [Mycobacterium sp.]|nr:helix-turn-helix domain-containing protein [Mycobacterium sp.]
MEAPVVMVGSDPVEVERRLRDGGLMCPCGGDLSPWGHARERRVRGVGVLRPRRARCGTCSMTHVLLTVTCLLRRADGADVIGRAVRAKATGAGHRPIAAQLGRPPSTVRGWLRAFARNAEAVRSMFTSLLVELDPLTVALPSHPGVFADAVEVIGACAAAARRRLGVVGAVSPWQLAAAVTGGRMLALVALVAPTVSINTSRLLGGAV